MRARQAGLARLPIGLTASVQGLMSLWLRVIVAIAAVKIAVSAYVAARVFVLNPHTLPTVIPVWMLAAIVAVYAVVGVGLIAGGRADVRARTFGALLVVTASAFSDVLSRSGHQTVGLAWMAIGLRADALLPCFLWGFTREFPALVTAGSLGVITRRVSIVLFVLGCVLMATSTAHDLVFAARRAASPEVLLLLARTRSSSYWPIVLALMLSALPVLALRVRLAGRAERRRVGLFGASLAVGIVPLAVDVLLRATSSGWNVFVDRPVPGGLVTALVVAAFISVPFTTSYCVAVHRVIDVRFIIRAAIRYGLARYTVLSLVVAPFVWLVWLLYDQRQETVQTLLFTPASVWPVSILALGLLMSHLRTDALDAIDRQFFREEYDAQKILTNLAHAARHADSSTRLATLLASEINRALHVDGVTVLVRSIEGDWLEPREGLAERDRDTPAPSAVRQGWSQLAPLSTASLLVQLLSGSDEPLDVDLGSPRSSLHRVGLDEQRWLVEARFQLLVPLRDAKRNVIGLIGLGGKMSELPYTAQDRRLLAAVGMSGGVFLDRRLTGETPGVHGPAPGAVDPVGCAAECIACGLVFDGGTADCSCGTPLFAALVPRVLAGKFRVERRVGAGGMGVVYCAEDLALGRQVALKTLLSVGSARVSRLRREARAMALVAHPNLGVIYGLETWQATPVLVSEFLSGGTLRDRLQRGPLPWEDVLALGLAVADALTALHARQVLHRDVKPSNIGYTEDGVPKLLDFGIVKLLGVGPGLATRTDVAGLGGDAQAVLTAGVSTFSTTVAGTPIYMAPEAIRGEAAGPSFDLWSLGVVMFEALTGVHPFAGRNLSDILRLIENEGTPDPGRHLAACPPRVATYFGDVLAAERERRPASGQEFVQRLRDLRDTLGPPSSSNVPAFTAAERPPRA